MTEDVKTKADQESKNKEIKESQVIKTNKQANKDDLEDDEDDDYPDSDDKYIKKLRKQNITWKARAAENKAELDKMKASEERIKESETKAADAIRQVTELKNLAEKRLISAEVKSISMELGLKKAEYSKLADSKDIKVDDNGDVSGVREMLEALKKSDPDLFNSTTTTNINFTRPANRDNIPKKESLGALTAEEAKRKEQEFLRDLRKR